MAQLLNLNILILIPPALPRIRLSLFPTIRQVYLPLVQKYLKLLIIIQPSGILITGGGYSSSAEVFIPSSRSECSLRSLPSPRRDHSQTGLTACGGHGYSGLQPCLEWQGGNWAETVRLQQGRYGQTAWARSDGLLLLGGGGGDTVNLDQEDAVNNAERITANHSEIAFPLKYKLK